LLAGFLNPAAEPTPFLKCWLVYALEVIAVAVIQFPRNMGLFMFAFGDRGSWLVVQYLTTHGYRPTIDFGYPYGMLPIMIGSAWFGIFGLTPIAFNLAMTSGGIAMAWGFARFTTAMRLSPIARILMVVALPIAIQSSLPSLAHLTEAVLLCLALGEHSRGNRRAALALATAACFAKAALAYLYGFLLVILIVVDCWGSRWRAAGVGASPRMDWAKLRRALIPAAVTGLLLIAILGSVYGVLPLTASLLPLNGMKIYATLHFGFFTPWSRTFWDPRGVSMGSYFATVAPFWMGSTLWLAIAAAWAGGRLCSSAREDESRNRDEIIFCCAVLQTLFVLRIFGPPLSWTYYPYIVVMGLAASSLLGTGPAIVAVALTVVAFVAQVVNLGVGAAEWKISTPSPITAGLWAHAGERAEWTTVAHLIAGHRTVAVGVAGGASILFPDFEKPIGAYLAPAAALPAEAERSIARIKAADMVVRPASESIGDPISFWPDLTHTLDHLEVVWKGRVYQVCRRR
jgi:hypothetical protein